MSTLRLLVGLGNPRQEAKDEFVANAHMSAGSDPRSTITGAGIMNVSSMSPYAVDGRAYVCVTMSIYVKRAERVHGESDISMVRQWDVGQ